MARTTPSRPLRSKRSRSSCQVLRRAKVSGSPVLDECRQSLVGALPIKDDERVQSKFHAGSYDGFLIRDPQVIILLRTNGNGRLP